MALAGRDFIASTPADPVFGAGEADAGSRTGQHLNLYPAAPAVMRESKGEAARHGRRLGRAVVPGNAGNIEREIEPNYCCAQIVADPVKHLFDELFQREAI